MSSEKQREAQESLKMAEKAASQTMMKRLVISRMQYAKMFPEAIDCFMNAAECRQKDGDLYFSARCLENVAQICVRDLKKPEEAAKYYKRASDMFRANNNPDRALEMLEKGGKALELGSPENAIPFFAEACELYVDEDRKRLGVETFKKVISLNLKLKRLDEALKFSSRLCDLLVEIDGKHLTQRQFLSTIILLLAFGDEVEANKRFERFATQSQAWLSSDEGHIARDMLDAHEKRDPVLLNGALKKQLITFLDNEVVKVARSLPLASAGAPPPIPSSRPPEVTTSLVDEAPGEKVPEESNDLC